MTHRLNLFIEGIPGSGKSTLLSSLHALLPDYAAYAEGDLSPVDLAWCARMPEDAYQKTLRDWPDLAGAIAERTTWEDGLRIVAYTKVRAEDLRFYEDMERWEVYGGRMDIQAFSEITLRRFRAFQGTGNLFECAFFQNLLEELMLFGQYEDGDILRFYAELIGTLDLSAFRLLRLRTPNVAESIRSIRRERVNAQGEEVWYSLMLGYLARSPYGRAHGCRDFEGVVAHFERRIALEDRVCALLPAGRCVELPSKGYDLRELPGLLQ